MTMDQRWSKRHRLSLPVDVVVGPGRVVSGCESRDIGLGGVFVRCEGGAEALEGEEVELIFHLGRGRLRQQHRLHARLVRRDAEGAGFVFRDFDTAAFRALQQILHQAIAS